MVNQRQKNAGQHQLKNGTVQHSFRFLACGSRLHFSSIPPGHHRESGLHTPADHFSGEAMDSFCFPKKTKNPNPSPIGKKFGFCCSAPPETRTLGPLIKRNQRATIVNFQNHTVSLFLAFCRDFALCILCIICTWRFILHPLSSRSGVQKVCKNVQSQNQPLKTGIGFLCKAGKMAGFEPKMAAAI